MSEDDSTLETFIFGDTRVYLPRANLLEAWAKAKRAIDAYLEQEALSLERKTE